MLRSLVAAAAAALLVTACGDSDDGGPAPPPGISGTVSGQPFTPADASALVLSAATCDFDGTAANATGLLIGFGSFHGLCALVTGHAGCANKANATIVTALLVRANVVGGDAGPVRPGTYTVSAQTPVPDAQGNITIPQALISKTDAACGTPQIPVAIGGTIRIDAIGPNVTGSADLTFDDGSRVAGDFSTPACGFQTDVCTALAGGNCTAEPCVP
jgi:hypothetical protein